MDELKDILIQKAKIIGQCKYPQKNSRQSTLKFLKKIRKQQKQKQYEENQLIQSIIHQKIITKEQIQKAYFMFFSIMKSFCKKFQFIPQQKDLFQNIISLNVNFYQKQQAFGRAQEVKKVYKKKLCQKQFLISTLFRWLHEWGRKRLSNFLKENIQSIQKDLLFEKLEINEYKQYQNLNIKSNFALDGTLKKLSNSERMTIRSHKKGKYNLSFLKDLQFSTQKSLNESLNVNKNAQNQLLQTDQNQLIDINHNKPLLNLIQDDNNKQFKQISQNNINIIGTAPNAIKKVYRLINCRQKTKIQTYVNKQIFFGTFWQQMNSYYKNLNCIEDLDMYYLKTFKKQNLDKKAELLKDKIQQITESIIKSMPHIKKSIENYDIEYQNNCPEQIKVKKITKSEYKFTQQTQKKYFLQNLLGRTKNQNSSFRARLNTRSKNSNYNINQTADKQIQHKKMITQSKYKRDQILEGINHSYNDQLQKIYQIKNREQIKLPIVYNPENICINSEMTASNPSIHNTLQKINHNKIINKGIVRYKILNQQQNKVFTPHQAYEKLNYHCNSQIIQSKNKQYEVPNIRKILRKRQKQKNMQEQSIFNKNQFSDLYKQKTFHSEINVRFSNRKSNINEEKYLIFLKNSFYPTTTE